MKSTRTDLHCWMRDWQKLSQRWYRKGRKKHRSAENVKERNESWNEIRRKAKERSVKQSIGWPTSVNIAYWWVDEKRPHRRLANKEKTSKGRKVGRRKWRMKVPKKEGKILQQKSRPTKWTKRVKRSVPETRSICTMTRCLQLLLAFVNPWTSKWWGCWLELQEREGEERRVGLWGCLWAGAGLCSWLV